MTLGFCLEASAKFFQRVLVMKLGLFFGVLYEFSAGLF